MNLRIIATIVIAVALAASHWKAYVKGQNDKQVEWNIDKIEQLKLARQRDAALQSQKEKALEEQKTALVKNALAADRARIASDRLRDTSERSLAAARETHAACVISAAAHAELFGECRAEYRQMGQAAQGHATDIKALIEAWPK